MAIGPRDLENNQVELARRDTLSKSTVAMDGLTETVKGLLEEIQENLYKKAADFRENQTRDVNNWEEFKAEIEKGGFLSAHWDGTPETEDKIKELTKATIRCVPLNQKEEEGTCVLTGKPSKGRVLFARAY